MTGRRRGRILKISPLSGLCSASSVKLAEASLAIFIKNKLLSAKDCPHATVSHNWKLPAYS